jgi:hypothetical protein
MSLMTRAALTLHWHKSMQMMKMRLLARTVPRQGAAARQQHLAATGWEPAHLLA